MRPTLAAFLLLAAAPLAAQAACPTADDVAAGVAFTLGSGETETYRPAGDSVIEVIFDDGLGYQSRTLLGQGLYLLEIVDLEDGAPVPDTRATYAHRFKPADMPPPQPEMVWASQVTATGDGFAQELHDHRGGALSTITVGECRFETFRVTVTYDDEENSVDTLQYLPQLGFALLIGVDSDGEDGARVTDVYSYLDVSAGAAPQPEAPTPSAGGRKERASD